MIFPLSPGEDRAIRWATRILPVVAVAVTALLGVISVASAGV